MKAEIYAVLNSEEIASLGYQVVVECWNKKSYGRVKRAWLEEFPSETDRTKARTFYNLFYKWCLVSGPPEEWRVKPHNYRFVQRLINFFGSNC